MIVEWVLDCVEMILQIIIINFVWLGGCYLIIEKKKKMFKM